jgi:hypothetical protein
MTEQQQHPITPPPELVEQWCRNWTHAHGDIGVYLATQAARWGADQELKACEEWLPSDLTINGESLRDARRPKPPSLAEQALTVLEQTMVLLMPVTGPEKIKRFEAIRTALERLQELEKGNE